MLLPDEVELLVNDLRDLGVLVLLQHFAALRILHEVDRLEPELHARVVQSGQFAEDVPRVLPENFA